MYRAEILILEMTFVAADHRPDLIRKLGHIHLDDVVARRDQFQNQQIIAAHFSSRYHPRQVKQIVEQALPGLLDQRLHLWM